MALRFIASRAGGQSATVIADGEGIRARDEPMEFARRVVDCLRNAK